VKNKSFNDSHAFVPLLITGVQRVPSVSNEVHADLCANCEYALKIVNRKYRITFKPEEYKSANTLEKKKGNSACLLAI
jgi:hypothetical protein